MRRCRVGDTVLELDLSDWLQRLYYLGQTDTNDIRLLRQFVPVGGTVIDVGAYVGLYTCAAASHVTEAGSVISFEPNPASRTRLEGNIALNRFANVTVHQAGLSDHSATLPLYVPPDHPGGPSSAACIGDPGGWQKVGEVAVRQLDEFLDLDRVDFIKTDAQGFDLAVIRGGLHLVSKFRPVIMCEAIEPEHAALQQLADSLEDYEVWSVGRDGAVLLSESRGRWANHLMIPAERVSLLASS
jgi:FkbM family methyltransferase